MLSVIMLYKNVICRLVCQLS